LDNLEGGLGQQNVQRGFLKFLMGVERQGPHSCTLCHWHGQKVNHNPSGIPLYAQHKIFFFDPLILTLKSTPLCHLTNIFIECKIVVGVFLRNFINREICFMQVFILSILIVVLANLPSFCATIFFTFAVQSHFKQAVVV